MATTEARVEGTLEIDAAGLAGERRLLDRARRGEAGAFAELVRLHDRGCRQLAYRLLGDRVRMDDALQEAYVDAFRALPRFRPQHDHAFRAWILRIVHRACVDELRRRDPGRGAREIAETPARDDVAATAERRLDLAAALAALDVETRSAVLLVDLLGLDYASAGAASGVPAGTVGSRLNRGRALLRRALEGGGS